MIETNLAEIEKEFDDLLLLIESLEADLLDCVTLSEIKTNDLRTTSSKDSQLASARESLSDADTSNRELVTVINDLRAANAALSRQIVALLEEEEAKDDE